MGVHVYIKVFILGGNFMFYNTTKNGNTWNVESKGSGDFIHLLESEKFYKKEYLSKWHNDPMES